MKTLLLQLEEEEEWGQRNSLSKKGKKEEKGNRTGK